MPTPPRRFLGYRASKEQPNIVVDGAPNRSTVLTLTHWPHQPQPPGINGDTSTEMVLAHLDSPVEHEPAEVVTNNHFDQDGAAGMFALIDPAAALEHRDLLVDLADAGDFGTYRHRDAARASMTLNAFADQSRSPVADRLTGDLATDTARLYEAVLPRLLDLLLDPEPFRHLWAAEDEELTASEEAIERGRVEIEDHADLDLAVVRIDDSEPVRTGHRFGHLQLGPIHPFAVNNATDRTRVLLIHRNRFRYLDRYETWVQVWSRTPPLRVDLRPLAGSLSRLEGGGATWTAASPSNLTPQLDHEGDSTLEAATVIAAIRQHLEAAPPAWDPRQPR